MNVFYKKSQHSIIPPCKISDIRKVLNSKDFLDLGLDMVVDKLEELENKIKQIEKNQYVTLNNP